METTRNKVAQTDRERIDALQTAYSSVADLELARGEAMFDPLAGAGRLREINAELAAAERELKALVDAAYEAAA